MKDDSWRTSEVRQPFGIRLDPPRQPSPLWIHVSKILAANIAMMSNCSVRQVYF